MSNVDHVPSNQDQAFDHWKQTYETFGPTSSAFLDESVQLDLLLQQTSVCDWPRLKSSLTYIDTVLVSLDIPPPVRAILGTIRNRSRTLVPLSILPPELMIRILNLADSACVLELPRLKNFGRSYSNTPLASVSDSCKWLRSIAINEPSLWTHIDLTMSVFQDSSYTGYARLCLQRSGRKSLYLHLVENKEMDDIEVNGALNFLRPHMRRVRSAFVVVASPASGSLVLRLFSDLPDPCELAELVIGHAYLSGSFSGLKVHTKLFGKASSRVWRHLKVLGIYGHSLHLHKLALNGLTTLKMYAKPPTRQTTASQLALALAACPDLRELALINCYFTKSSGESVVPVVLPRLEMLDVRAVFGVLEVLGCLVPSSNALTLSLSLDESTEGSLTVGRLVKRFNVTRLLLDRDRRGRFNYEQALTMLKLGFPSVQELALGSYLYSNPSLRQALSVEYLPSLHTLHFLEGSNISPEACRELLSFSAVCKVYANRFYDDPLDEPQSNPMVQDRAYAHMADYEKDFPWPLMLSLTN